MKMNYFVFGTNNLPAAVSFYDTLFSGTGISKIHSEGRMTIWAGDGFMFGVAEPYNGEAATNGNGTMLGINLGSASEVELFSGCKRRELLLEVQPGSAAAQAITAVAARLLA